MKILHVTSGINPKSGGPTRSVKGVCRALATAGLDVTLLVLRGTDVFENPSGVKVLYGEVPDVRDFDIVHIHGLWNPHLHSVARECRKYGVKYLVSPRGMLDPWALSVKKWKKRIALFLYQRSDLNAAAAFHATAEEEASHIRAAGFGQPCIIAPNAVDLPDKMPPKINSVKMKTAIFLSRLHPGKGLLSLAQAWAVVKPRDWRMRVVGPDNYGHKKEVVAKLDSLGILNQWDFCDALGDEEKWKAYRSADLLIHPSVSENFGITVVEGLASELPVIATKGTPWSELESRRCGWWIDIGVEPLSQAMREALALSDEERQQMGAHGRRLVEEKYTWNAVVKAMTKGYESVICKS